MRLHRLILHNIAQHEHLDWTFAREGLIAVVGPNGSGEESCHPQAGRQVGLLFMGDVRSAVTRFWVRGGIGTSPAEVPLWTLPRPASGFRLRMRVFAGPGAVRHPSPVAEESFSESVLRGRVFVAAGSTWHFKVSYSKLQVNRWKNRTANRRLLRRT